MSPPRTHEGRRGIFTVAWTPWGVWCVADSQKQAVNNVWETGVVRAWPNTHWIIRTLLSPPLHRQAGLRRNHPLSPHYPWQATSIPPRDTVSLPACPSHAAAALINPRQTPLMHLSVSAISDSLDRDVLAWRKCKVCCNYFMKKNTSLPAMTAVGNELIFHFLYYLFIILPWEQLHTQITGKQKSLLSFIGTPFKFPIQKQMPRVCVGIKFYSS